MSAVLPASAVAHADSPPGGSQDKGSSKGFDLWVQVGRTEPTPPGQTLKITLSWGVHGSGNTPSGLVTFDPPRGSSLVAADLPGGWILTGRAAAHDDDNSTGSAAFTVLVTDQVRPGSRLHGGLATIAAARPAREKTTSNNVATFAISVSDPQPAPTATPVMMPAPAAPSPKATMTASPTLTPRATSSSPSRPTDRPSSEPQTVAKGLIGEAASTRRSELRPTTLAAKQTSAQLDLPPLAAAMACFLIAGFGWLTWRRQARLLGMPDPST